MAHWLKNISWRKTLLSAFLYLILASIVSQIESILTVKYYLMPQYLEVWNRFMMPGIMPPGPVFFILKLFFIFVNGLVLAVVYETLRPLMPKRFSNRVFWFAELMVLLQFIFFFLKIMSSFNVPIDLLISWFISNMIVTLLASVIFVKVIE